MVLEILAAVKKKRKGTGHKIKTLKTLYRCRRLFFYARGLANILVSRPRAVAVRGIRLNLDTCMILAFANMSLEQCETNDKLKVLLSLFIDV